jgi:hypothetical protein
MNSVEDINANVAVRGGANAYVLPAFGNYPKTLLGKIGEPTGLPAAKLWEDGSTEFTAQMPAGWQRVKFADQQLFLSNHGYLLDTLTVDRLKSDAAAADPLEIGSRAVAAMKADPAYADLKEDHIEPRTVSGLPGFCADTRFVRAYLTALKVPFRQRLCGVATKKGLYLVKLEAPSSVYFEEDLPAFESMLASLKIELGKVKPVGQKRKH